MDIKQFMKEKGITQTSLARKLGVTQSSISSALNGHAKRATLEKLAEAMGITYEELSMLMKQTRLNDPLQQAFAEIHKTVFTFNCPCCGERYNITIEKD